MCLICDRSKQGSGGGTGKVGGKPGKNRGSLSDGEGHGVSVADEETIMSHMDAFCNRIRQVLDVINTMSQFTRYIIIHVIDIVACQGSGSPLKAADRCMDLSVNNLSKTTKTGWAWHATIYSRYHDHFDRL